MHNHLKTTVRWILLLILVALPILCLAIFGYLFFWQPDPISPPATELGDDPEFDRMLSDLSQEWTFLLRDDGRIISTDIYGQDTTVLLNIVDATNNADTELLEHVSISPSGARTAINYHTRYDPVSGEPDGRIMILDINNGSILDVPLPVSEYVFDWTKSPYWLTDEVFIVKMHRFPGNASSEQYRLLLYNLDQISSPEIFDFDPCPLTTVLNPRSQALLLASDCVPLDQREVWAIDADGKRMTSPDEIAYFDQHSWDIFNPQDNYQHPSGIFPIINIEHIWAGPEGFGRFYEANWNRDYLYFGNYLVRISDGFINFEPDWQTNIELFIWTEGNKTYFADKDGHYRLLYNGVYLGKTPRNK